VIKIFALNPNVGSAIEYMGNTVVSWLKEIGDVYDCKHQTRTSHYLKFMYEYKPDIIVTNELYSRAVAAANIYKHLTGTPFIHVDHVWKRLNSSRGGCREIYEYEVIKEVREEANWIFCVNYKPSYEPWHKRIEHKVSNRYYATNPDVFKVVTPWLDRDMFCYIGNMLPHKLSSDFLAKVCDTDLVVDCYGSDLTTNDSYGRSFKRAQELGNINYKGLIPQDKIAEIMNKYKYLVLPHCGYEPFNWVLKQCIYCGTIPLITNDRDSQLYDGKWLDWATGLYMGCKFTNDFINNLKEFDAERPDHSDWSESISTQAKTLFPYQEFKEEFQSKVRELLNG